MSYNKHTWTTGNVVGAVDLNRMEQGIEDAGSGQVLVVNSVYDSNNNKYTLDKTWQEIYDAFPFVVFINTDDLFKGVPLTIGGDIINEDYFIEMVWRSFVTNSPNGYPTTAEK